MGIQAAGLAHRGRREKDQDRVVCKFDEQTGIFAAIDGMGGPEDGDRAADTACQLISPLHGQKPSGEELIRTFTTADKQIKKDTHLRFGEVTEPPGCVMTAVWLDNGGRVIHLAHQGDTRAYLSNPHDPEAMQRLTTDHSVVGERLTGLSEAERMLHPLRSFVTRFLGDCLSFPDYGHRTWETDYGLLLCSDGLCDPVHERIIACVMAGMWKRKTEVEIALDMIQVEEIHHDLGIEKDSLIYEEVGAILARAIEGLRTPEQIAEDLIDLSLAYQRLPPLKPDNIAVVVIKVTL